MEDFLKTLIKKQVDIAFGANATVRGEIVDVKAGVLYLKDEDERVAYVSVERIAVVWEVKDTQSRPGFLG